MSTEPSPEQERRLPTLPVNFRPLELWGGIECTINRVGDRYVDQIELSGHARRDADLDLFADLGIKTVRYPVLWERVAPRDIRDARWEESDRALSRLRELGIRPIVGLVHHGSGPLHTNLVDQRFARRLEEFARAVAERYPWIDAYTPVNEPLTTARFSALYGFWYPHAREDRSFVRAFLNQCAGIRAAMSAIREVNPGAKLVQTEDLGKTYSTPPLRYQADFDNHRRWLTYDLLTGRVIDTHRLWHFMIEAGVDRAELISFAESPCPPDVIGVNYYLTSERFLDHRVDLYPRPKRGGNGRDAYADVEAVRVLPDGIAGHRGILTEAADRYHLPLAITEVHLGCTREQQLRWLDEAWAAAHDLRSAGVDIRAVTLWSLLGSFGWDALLTGESHTYEPGAFDLRAPSPRPTALARMARALTTTGTYSHPVVRGPGWWRTSGRLLYPGAFPTAHNDENDDVAIRVVAPNPILIIGGTGTLGSAFVRACRARGNAYVAPTRGELNITDPGSVERVINAVKPWAVINAAGYVRVDDAEWDRDACYEANTVGAVNVAIACTELDIPLLTFSSDLVFDGKADRPYVESDTVNPLGVYGESKARAEERILALRSRALIVRTSAFFGPWDAHNFLTHTLNALTNGAVVQAPADLSVSPTYVPDLVNASIDVLIDGECGIWHLANIGAVTWSDFARIAARAAGLSCQRIIDKPAAAMRFAAPRPAFSALASKRGALMPSLQDAVERYVAERSTMTAPALAGRG
jgi:dTDP-4-dehydrorhamnose reductase